MEIVYRLCAQNPANPVRGGKIRLIDRRSVPSARTEVGARRLQNSRQPVLTGHAEIRCGPRHANEQELVEEIRSALRELIHTDEENSATHDVDVVLCQQRSQVRK